MESVKHVVKIVVEEQSVNMNEYVLSVKIVEGNIYANTDDKNTHVKNVMVVKFVSTNVINIYVESVVERVYVNITRFVQFVQIVMEIILLLFRYYISGLNGNDLLPADDKLVGCWRGTGKCEMSCK